MIKSLYIKNYALIQHLQMEPSAHLSTITGETGAGKSIMLGALGLLLGSRADTKVLFDADQKCIIEAVFIINDYNLSDLFKQLDIDYQDECIIRREINKNGKSRAFVNDTPVTLDILKTVGHYLVDIHSQRDTSLLSLSSHQLDIIDNYSQNQSIRAAYQQAYTIFKKEESEYHNLLQQSEEIKKEADYNHFLFDELNKANLQPEEQETLEEELKIIDHAEEIKTRLLESEELLENHEYSITAGLSQVLKNIANISRLADHYAPLQQRLESTLLELGDISKEIQRESLNIDFDEKRKDEIQERLGLLFQLLQKHHATDIEELLKLQDDLANKVDRSNNMEELLLQAKERLTKSTNALESIAAKLTKSRKSVFEKLQRQLLHLLKELAMPDAQIDFRHQPVKATANGMDKISIFFSANAGIPMSELKNVASGGEFSRLMFCIKYVMANKTALPTIIFDEIDTGISGEIALKMVQMMKDMSGAHQVIAITHLPQIAASGHEHYFVFKENKNGQAVSSIKKLDHEHRRLEIAKMIGGDNPSEAALESALELLNRE